MRNISDVAGNPWCSSTYQMGRQTNEVLSTKIGDFGTRGGRPASSFGKERKKINMKQRKRILVLLCFNCGRREVGPCNPYV